MQEQDWHLLRDYVEHDSQIAFSGLVERYLNLVYATCLREVGDCALAEDVTQVVFLLFARKAPTLKPDVVLSGWFFQTARFASNNARRREQRWRQRTEQAMEALKEEQEAMASTRETTWARLEPLVHEGLVRLGEVERNAVLLKCFEGRTLKETAEVLGISEEAARKRVTRALEKLRGFFRERGVVLSVVAIVALLSTQAVKAAPLSCASVVKAVLSAPALSPTSHPLAGESVQTGLKSKGLTQHGPRSLTWGKAGASVFAIGGVVGALIMTQVPRHQSLRAPPMRTAVTSVRLSRPRVPALTQPQISSTHSPLLVPTTVSQIPLIRDREANASHSKETIHMKKSSTIVMALSAASLLSVPVLADSLNARVKAVDPGAHTITVLEAQKNYVFDITQTTRFVDAQGKVLAVGWKIGKTDTLVAGLKSGKLKAGTRLSITFEKRDEALLASQVQLRDTTKESHK